MVYFFQHNFSYAEQNMSVVDESRHINIDILIIKRSERKMSKSRIVVPEAKQAMENFKMEAAREVGVPNPY